MIRRLLACLSLSFVLGTAVPAFCANPPQSQPVSRITEPVDANRRFVLKGSVHPLAQPQYDKGAVVPSMPMERMLLVLKRSAAQDKALAAAIKEMSRPGSKTFHRWMTAEEVGAQYGVSQDDVNTVTAWLAGAGFHVSSVSKARGVIEFSGSAQQVSSAFHTEIHSYLIKGKTYTANAKDPEIPAALAPVVAGFVSLNNFPIKGAHTDSKVVTLDKTTKTWSVVPEKGASGAVPGTRTEASQTANPELTTKMPAGNTIYGVTPYDFATIYNLTPLWNAGLDGTGQQIAIVAESDILVSDVDQFRAAFGLPTTRLNIIDNGTPAGLTADSDQQEAEIDVEWAGAVAKNATIDLVSTASTGVTTGLYLSMTYAVDNAVAPVVEVSYEYCEWTMGVSGNLFMYQTWQQAAAEGITVVVAAGDTGSAGCDNVIPLDGVNGMGVSAFASTPYDVAVGGTDFYASYTNPSTYWNTTNDPTTQASALSYIPEVPWNNSCASPEVFAAFGGGTGSSSPLQWCDNQNIPATYLQAIAGGGGPSNCSSFNVANFPNQNYCAAGYPKPDWQAGVNGIPNDGARDLPDVSLFSSDLTFNTAYLYCLTDPILVPSCNFNTSGSGALTYEVAGGTSFAAPTFAGMVALVNQKTNSSQGLANYYLYSMATQEFGGTASPNDSQTLSCNSGSNQGGGNTCTFYDVTVGTNEVPCFVFTPDCTNGPTDTNGITTGYFANPGYDMTTGLGSVNATNLVNNWAALTAITQPTSVTLSTSSTTSNYGQPVTLSGSVTPLSGSGTPPGSIAIEGMQLNQASIPVVNGSYSQVVQNLLPGAYTVTANYVGDGGYQSSVSQPVGMVILAATATSTVAFSATDTRSGGTIPSSNGQIPYGNNVVAMVTVLGLPLGNGVLAPTGSITFSSNSKPVATVPLTGNTASYTTTANHLGSQSLTVAYSGDQNYNSAGAVTQTYTVVQDATSIEAHANAAIVASGTPVTLTASVISNSHFALPTGTVSFSLNGAVVGTVPAVPFQDPITLQGFDSATLVVPASKIATGNNVVVATYSGDPNFLASTSIASTFVSVNGQQGAQMTITASTTTATNLTPVTIQAALTANGAPVTQGTVNFTDNGRSIAQVQVVGLNPSKGAKTGTATLVTRLPVGTHEIVGIFSGVGNLIHPIGNGLPPITVTGEQITNTIVSAVNDVGTPANYDVTALVVAGGVTAPSGTLTLEEPSLNVALNSAALSPDTEFVGLTPLTSGTTGSQNSAILVGDFNGDGILDYAAISINLDTQLMVYLGNGDGSFQPGIGTVTTNDPTLLPFTTMAAADFNGDGILDIVLGNATGAQYGGGSFGGTDAVMMLGNGDGTFRQGQELSVPAVAGGLTSAMGSLVTADFNNDGIPDIAFSNYGLESDASVEVFFGVGDGTFTNTPTLLANVGSASSTNPTINLLTGDLNHDGNADLVALDNIDSTATVFLGKGDGTFQAGAVFSSGNSPMMGALGDVNGDGYLDLVVPNLVLSSGTGSSVSVFLNNGVNGPGTFGAPTAYASNFPNQVVLADLNNDGILDIVQAEDNGGHVDVMYGSANGSFTFSQFTQTRVNVAGAWQVAVIDTKNSGHPDILVDEELGNSVGVLLNGMVSTTQFLNVALDGPAADSETLSATYSGDNANLTSTAPSIMLAGSNATIATKLSWTPGANSTIFGTAVPSSLLNAQVANSVPGTITYVAQSNTGTITPVSPGTILPAAGAYSITATFTPTSPGNYAQSNASTVFNVAKAGVTETLTSSAAQAAAGASVTFTDTVISNTTGTPTGSVTFFAGSLALGTSAISSTGIATITTINLPAGTSSIMASYTGDSNFTSGTAATISVSVGSPSIVLAVGQPTMTITAGATGMETLTVTPQLGYTGDVSFTCGSLPTGVTCSFSPSIGAISGGPFQSALTVTTAAPSSTASLQNKPGTGMIVAGTAVSMASVLLIGLPGRRKRMSWAVLFLIAGISAISVGCGGSGSTKTTVTGPTASTLALASSGTKIAIGSTVTLSATVTGSNAASATGSIVFYDGATQIGQANIANGVAQLTLNSLSVGIHAITASYAGDTLNQASNTASAVEQAVTGQTFFTVIAASGNVSQSSVVSLTLQ